MKNDFYKVKIQRNGDIQVKILKPITLLELLESMQISKDKRKKTQISLNGNVIINHGQELKEKDQVVLHCNDNDDYNEQISYEPVDIVYEDDYCLVANKPPFLLVHSDGNEEDTLQARVNAHLQETGWPYNAQASHRIDYEAQGLVLFCKHPLLQNYFDSQFADGSIKKEYLAVIDGSMAKKHIDLNNPIAKNRHEANKMIVYRQGKPAHTHIETLGFKQGKSLVKANITTGRRHQIRVHLAHNGHPIVNDSLYSNKSSEEPLQLQSSRLVFKQPFSDEVIEVEADFPKEFKPFTKRDIKK